MEQIEMQFEMLRRVGPIDMYYMGVQMPPHAAEFPGVWQIEKQCRTQDFAGWLKGNLCIKWVD